VLIKGGGFGLIGDLVVGIIGALIGGLFFSGLAGLAGFAGGGLLGSTRELLQNLLIDTAHRPGLLVAAAKPNGDQPGRGA